MNIQPGQNPMYVKPLFNNEDDLLDQLEKDDPPSAKTRKYLYRGQLGRFEKLWHEIMHGDYPRNHHKMDSIIPTDSRFLSERIANGDVNDTDFLFQYGNLLAQVRSASTFFVLQQRNEELGDQEISRWLAAQTERPKGYKFDKIGSIGQHYGVKTTYLDATTSIQVALFFATYDFKGNAYAGAGERVIYRIHKDKLLRVQDEINKRDKLRGLDRHRAVDLADTPEQFAPRAIKQAGWSIINFELSNLLEHLIEKGAITAFRFRSGSDQHARNSRTLDTIIPPNDALAHKFEQYAVQGQTQHDLQGWFDQYVNPNRSDQNKVYLNDDSWISKFFSIYVDWNGL